MSKWLLISSGKYSSVHILTPIWSRTHLELIFSTRRSFSQRTKRWLKIGHHSAWSDPNPPITQTKSKKKGGGSSWCSEPQNWQPNSKGIDVFVWDKPPEIKLLNATAILPAEGKGRNVLVRVLPEKLMKSVWNKHVKDVRWKSMFGCKFSDTGELLHDYIITFYFHPKANRS
jgi:hypothetical protein